MLVLSRKPGEKVLLSGGITITVVQVARGRIRLGLEAPDHVEILRAEVAGKEPVSTAEGRPVAKPR